MQKTTREEWTPEALARVSEQLKGSGPQHILGWALRQYSTGICLASSFGPQSIALMHMISKLRPETTIFYLDTDLLFPETYALRDELAARLGLEFTRVEAAQSLEQQARDHGEQLWTRDPGLCCYLRKVAPLRRFLSDKRAWITGIRARQTALRAESAVVEWDASNGLVKVNPMLNWRREQVWDYLLDYDLPFNALHDAGYPSIGCRPCTRPVLPGDDDERAGRWAGTEKTECGIHARRLPAERGTAPPQLLNLGEPPAAPEPTS